MGVAHNCSYHCMPWQAAKVHKCQHTHSPWACGPYCVQGFIPIARPLYSVRFTSELGHSQACRHSSSDSAKCACTTMSVSSLFHTVCQRKRMSHESMLTCERLGIARKQVISIHLPLESSTALRLHMHSYCMRTKAILLGPCISPDSCRSRACPRRKSCVR